MFDAKFHYTNKIINNLMEISAIKEFILNSQIMPSYDLLLKNKAIITSSYNSTSIEGNPLDFKEVTELFNLKENNKINDVDLNKSEIEVLNYFKTIENLDKYEKIDEKTILEIHQNITEGTLNDSNMAGKFRDSQVVIGNIKTGKLNLVPPKPIEVPYLIRELLDWVNVQDDLNPIILAGIFHYEFVRIHPFVDGNGRVARLLMNLALLRAGWSLAIIPPIYRHEYIATLDKAGRTPAPFVRFIRDRVCETQKELLRLMGQSIALDDEDAGDRVNGRLDDRVNDRVNDGITKNILDTIVQRPGVRTNEIATHIGKSIPTVSRHIKILKDSGKIEFRGAPKNGGHFAI